VIEKNLIEHRGRKKTGGYFFKEESDLLYPARQ